MRLNTPQLEAILAHGSYFDERQVSILDDLARFVREHGELPTAKRLAAFLGRDELSVRNDLARVSLEGLLWALGVDDER